VGNGNGSLLLILVLFALLLFASSRSRRRVQRQREETLGRLQAGAQVITTSGLHASVVEVLDDGTVRLETSPGQVSLWDRMAVARVEPPAAAERVVESGTETGNAPGGIDPAVGPGIEPAVEPPAGPAAETGRRGIDGVQDNAPPDRA
jgi:preprotein translocase subunit YajC